MDAPYDLSDMENALSTDTPSDAQGADTYDLSDMESALASRDTSAPSVAPSGAHQVRRWNPPATQAPSGRTPTQPNASPPSVFSGAGLADIGKTVASQGTLGATADLIGLPATINQLWQKGTGALEGLGANAANAVGMTDTAKALLLAKQQAQAKLSVSDKAGDTSNIFGWEAPTAQAVERGLVQAVPQLGYAPKTQAAKIIGAGARALPLGLLTGPEGVIGKLAMAGASGALSEIGGEATAGTPYEPYARILGAVVGAPLAGGAIRAVGAITPIAQEAAATRALTGALAQDQASGAAPMTIKQASTVPGAGAWNAAGPNTKALVQRMAMTPNAQDAVLQLNQMAATQKATAAANIAGHISDTLGLDQAPFDLQSAIKKADADNVNNLYQTMGNSQEAQAVTSPVLNRLSQSDTIQALGKKAASVATDPESRIVAPTATAPGNIFYWDQIKQGLDDGYSVAQRTGENGEARRLTGLKKQLVGELDTQVPGYADARGAAADSFGAQNAVEAGYNLAAKKANNFSAGQVQSTFNKLNPQQQAMFAQGAGGYLKEIGLNNGPDQVIKTMTDVNKAPILQAALGNDNYGSILGKAYNESFLKNARTLSVGVGEAPSTMDQVFNANALMNAPSALGHLVLSGNPLPLGGLIASKAAEGLIGSYKSAVDQAQAKTVLGLLGTQDPKKLAQLGKMVSSSPKNQGFFYGLGNAIRRATVRAVIANPPAQSETNPQSANPPSGMQHIKNAVSTLESGGNYSAVGPQIQHPNGAQDQALGKYQVLSSNLPSWSQKYYGAQLTPAEFLANPGAQEKVFDGAFGDALQKFGNMPDAVSWWHSGKPLAQATAEGLHDVNMSTPSYVGRVMGQMEAAPTAATGGRIARAAGGKTPSVDELIDRLMKRAQLAKKRSKEATKPLLGVPDSVMAKALAVAQRGV